MCIVFRMKYPDFYPLLKLDRSFFECTFKCAKLIGTNLKDRNLENAMFENDETLN